MIPKTKQAANWVDAAQEVQHVAVRLKPGALYLFRGMPASGDTLERRRWVFPPGTYRLIGSGVNVRTYQELVAYASAGIGGSSDGVMYFTTLADWAENFELVAEVAP